MADAEETQWTSTPPWQAYWKGKWNREEVSWERPPEEDIPSNVPSSNPDEAQGEYERYERDWWRPGWSSGWSRWNSWNSWDWDWNRSQWRWDGWGWRWDWDRWEPWSDWGGYGGYGGYGGWRSGWGDGWRDGWTWKSPGWSGWSNWSNWSNWSRSWDSDAKDAQPEQYGSWWTGQSEQPEAGYEERWEPETADKLEDEESTETNQDPPGVGQLFGDATGARLPSIPEQPALEEASPPAEADEAANKADAQEHQQHPHENEEWYQKWLRRQRNQPSHVVEIGAPNAAPSSTPAVAPLPEASAASSSSLTEAAPGAIDPLEKRVCPDDGKTYTFDELREAYKSEYSEEDLKGYWRDAMAAMGGAPKPDSKDDYKKEEWYQKWLRRQQNKNRQIIEIG